MARRRRERPAEIGRYPLLGSGAVCASAGGALWLTAPSAHPLGAAFVAFGLVLMALGGSLHLLLVRERDRWPERAYAWDEGIELVLHDGELRATAWDDPKLALDVFVRPRARSSEDERLLVWRMGSGVPACDLTQPGFDRLIEIVNAHGLRLSEYRRGRRAREARAYEIRARPTPRSVGPLAGSEASRSSP